MVPALIIGAIVLLLAIIIGACWYVEKKRTEALQAVADSLGFSFSRKGDRALPASLHGFHLFSQGHGRKMSNVLHGSANEIDVTIFDYRYTTGGGKNSHTWRQTVMLFESGKLCLPDFTLRPENLFHRIGGVFGYQDIDFDTHPTFSKQYLLRGSDEEAVRGLFHDDVLAHYAQHKGLSTEGAGGDLIFYRASRRVSPNDIRSFMEEGFGIFSLLKREG